MTPADVITLFEKLDQIIYLTQALLYMQFVLLGGSVALAFFSFWKRIV